MARRRPNKSQPRSGSHLVIVLPDMHLSAESPARDRDYLECALAVIRRTRPRRVVILGDMLDVAAFSSHPVTPLEQRAHDFIKDEIEQGREILDEINRHTKAGIAFVEGNHEARVARMCAKIPQLNAVRSVIEPRALLSYHAGGRRRRNPKRWTWAPYLGKFSNAHYEITPDLWAIHGWTHATHAAHVHLQRAKPISTIFGHVHRAMSRVERLLDGRLVRSMSPGCLSPLQPAWMHGNPTGWTHGFTMVYAKDDGSAFTSYNVAIEHGCCIVPSGEKIEAGDG